MNRQHFVEFRLNAKLKLRHPETNDDESETYVRNMTGPTVCEVQPGTRVIASVTCYVDRAKGRYTEVADMVLHDGTGTLIGVSCSCFQFLDVLD